MIDRYINAYDFAELIENLDITVLKELAQMPTSKVVPISEVFKVIAGHSNYHGDDILSALTCIAEGKEVNPIKPLESR